MSKVDEYREMSVDQLKAELSATQQSLFNLKFQSATEKLDAPSNIRKHRRNIARIHTVLRQRELTAAVAQ